MRATLLIHIAAGGLALVSGYIALYSAKGATLHRRSGMLFVYAMLVMALGGIVVAAGMNVAPTLNIPSALLTAYLVITSLATVRPPAAGGRWLDAGALLLVLGVVAACMTFGVRAIAAGGRTQGMAFPLFLFGVVGSLAAAGDLRMLRSGKLAGARRLARHLWRMTFALLIAAMSFFIGQADEIPEPYRIRPLLALPVLAVLVTMFYWLWRVRSKRAPRPGAAAWADSHS